MGVRRRAGRAKDGLEAEGEKDQAKFSASQTLDLVSALDTGGGSAPFTVRDSRLVCTEGRGVSEPFVNLPDQAVLTVGNDLERDATFFGASQGDMTRQMLGHGGDVRFVTADEHTRQM